MASQGVIGLLLAAGQGRRFIGDAQLYPLPDGTPMAVASARALLQACGSCVAMLRPSQLELARQLRAEGVRVVMDVGAALGLGPSLAAAVRATAGAGGWVVARGEMPFLAPATVLAVRDALLGGASLTAPLVQGKRAFPVGFTGRWYEALCMLQGEHCLSDLLRRHQQALTLLDCQDAGALIEVDSPGRLQACGAAARLRARVGASC